MEILSWSWRLGQSRYLLHWSWVLVAPFVAFSVQSRQGVARGLTLLGIWIASVMLRGLAASWTAGDGADVRIWPGGLLGSPGRDRGLGGELKTIAAGNLPNLALLALGYGLGWSLLAAAQVILLATNWCLPVYPMDLGRVVVGLGCRWLPTKAVARLAALLCAAVGIALLLRWLPVSTMLALAASGPLMAMAAMAWLFINALWLLSAADDGGLERHPLFSAPRARPRPRLALVKDRRCPGCGRSVAPTARMCGYCERVL